jgi:pimeloyl-ACP methyl ester carboxylesterase
MATEAGDGRKLWGLEEEFVVYWDQRTCAKSFSRGLAPQSMTVEQLIADTHELIQALTRRFDLLGPYLTGFSFAATITLLTTARHPEQVRGVVGVGPDVQFDEAGRVGYEFAFEQATRRRNNRAVRELRRLGPPPHLNSSASARGPAGKERPMASDIPVACTLSAADLRARGDAAIAPLFARAERLEELPDGYRFAFPAEASVVRDLLAFILSERTCCPFFTFELTFAPPHRSAWLVLRGGEGVKEFVAASFATLEMLIARGS